MEWYIFWKSGIPDKSLDIILWALSVNIQCSFFLCLIERDLHKVNEWEI